VAAGTLVAAAVRGGRAASTAGVVVGTAMLLTGLTTVMVWGRVPDLFTAGTGYIVVLLVAGASALFVGAYGRYTGGLSPDSPYSRVPRNAVPAHPPVRPVAADAVALCELAAAERQVAARSASLEVTAAVAAVRPFRRAEDRVSAWRARTAADFDPGLAVRT
jgi:hypothetical protein